MTHKIKKILLPVDFPNPSLDVLHQAAKLAQHFNAALTLLHVVTPAAHHPAETPQEGCYEPGADLLAEILKAAEKRTDKTLAEELSRLTIDRLVFVGDPARVIVRTAPRVNADLIMMPSHGDTFARFLLGSVTARVLHGSGCPIWTGAHVEEPSLQPFQIRNILCAVDFGGRSRTMIGWGSQLAAEFAARLTFAHVTGRVEMWGPGGTYVDESVRQALLNDATRRMAGLQQELGTHAETYIGSGDVPKVLAQAALETNADLMLTSCYPYDGHLRTHGYAIICAVQVPILHV